MDNSIQARASLVELLCADEEVTIDAADPDAASRRSACLTTGLVWMRHPAAGAAVRQRLLGRKPSQRRNGPLRDGSPSALDFSMPPSRGLVVGRGVRRMPIYTYIDLDGSRTERDARSPDARV